ncbi:hypothetical protein CYMTET_51435 [Cymbomonas tetramitiformis]|uniref:Uncharacterized protein n=1 Tax=Cymbomonas tetramitiformis TaxID=36881 RepID=A0AAE0BMJ6_9CHLO|nr:hypothetical protein CYMTET_51435 [Cymbomonas tetramitiformis]
MGLVDAHLLCIGRTRRDLRKLRAAQQEACLIYLAPDGTFEVEAEGPTSPSLDFAFTPDDGSLPQGATLRAARSSFAVEDLIAASESSDNEQGLTEAEDEAQELVCASHDLPGPAQDTGGRDPAEGLESSWEDDALALWDTARTLNETTARGRRTARSSRRKAGRLLSNPATSLDDSKPPDLDVQKLAGVEATVATEQKPTGAAPTPPPDEVDTDVPDWVWAELENNKEVEYKDVICSELPESGVQHREYDKSYLRLTEAGLRRSATPPQGSMINRE